MSDHQALAALRDKAETDAALREALQNAKTAEEVVQLAASVGLNVTADQIHALQQQQPADGQLTDADLEAVAGGSGFGNWLKDRLIRFASF